MPLATPFTRFSPAGWGITHDGRRLIVTDGSEYLHFWDPDTLTQTGRVRVHDPATGSEQGMLNEVEYIHGFVFANVWLSNTILIIHPDTGAIAGRWDMGSLSSRVTNARKDVLNGIAYTPGRGLPSDPGYNPRPSSGAWGGSLWVTGKRWDSMFELRLTDVQSWTPPASGPTRRSGGGRAAAGEAAGGKAGKAKKKASRDPLK